LLNFEAVPVSAQADEASTAPAAEVFPRKGFRGWVLRTRRSLPTMMLVLFCVFAGIPVAIALTPAQGFSVAGQHVLVDARAPSLSLWGPPQLVQIGNTELDIEPLRVYGPLRPRLTLGPVQRNADAAAALDPDNGADVRADAVNDLGSAMVRWYLLATLILFTFTLASIAVAGCIRMLFTLRRHSGRHPRHHQTVAEIWHRSSRQIRGMTTIAVLVSLLAWLGSGGLAFGGAVSGLQNVRSLTDLVGTYHLTPSAVGPVVTGHTGAVIGDSRAARVGGPELSAPSEDDVACARSADSLAAQLGLFTNRSVLNLACSGASIATGLRGPQFQGGKQIPPQLGRLKQVEGLQYVVVMIGPNDLNWTDLLRYCYGVPNCSDRLTQGEWDYRLASFDRDYGDLLRDLNDLPGEPQVVIVTSYDVFTQDARCDKARGVPARPISESNIALLASRNAELNDVLRAGAEKYDFTVASPRLSPLCAKDLDGLGPDLQGLTDGHPFHPTGLGELRIASAVSAVLKPTE
jgi:lysophospholipase L1-like esterase